MEEGIGWYKLEVVPMTHNGLNPYCSGRKNRIFRKHKYYGSPKGLNPYCSGRRNRISSMANLFHTSTTSLNPYCIGRRNRIARTQTATAMPSQVLILIVVEEGIGYLEWCTNKYNIKS